MFVGVSRPTAPHFPIPDVDAALVARHAENCGFESILYGEHPIRPVAEHTANEVHTEGVPYFQETIVALSRVSAMTTRIRFGFGVCLVMQHHPVRLAKQLACLDYYSGGRLMVGVGTGWSKAEAEAIGGNFSRRWAQTAEAVKLMRELWTKECVEHDGEFFKVPPVHCFPQPKQQPGPPILMGANGEKGFQRIVDFCDGWMPALVTPEQIAEGPEFIRTARAQIVELAQQKGRDMSRMPITVILRGTVDRDVIQRFEDTGIERVNIIIPYFETEDQAREQLEKLAANVL